MKSRLLGLAPSLTGLTLWACGVAPESGNEEVKTVSGFDCETFQLTISPKERQEVLEAVFDSVQVAAQSQGTEGALAELSYAREIGDWDRIEWVIGKELCENPLFLETPAAATPLNRMRLSALTVGSPAPLLSLPIFQGSSLLVNPRPSN